MEHSPPCWITYSSDFTQLKKMDCRSSKVTSSHTLWNSKDASKYSILEFLLEYFKKPKVAQTQAWWIRWIRNAIKLSIVRFIGHLATMEWSMCTKILSGEIYGKSPLTPTISSGMFLMKYSWLNHAPDSSAFKVIRLTPSKKIVDITSWALFATFSLGITLSRLAANTWSDKHQQRNQNSSLVRIREKE
jgi:hypothetical protein